MQKENSSTGKKSGKEEKSCKKEKVERPKPWGMTPKEGADDDNPAM